MNSSLDYFKLISIFGRFPQVLGIMLAANIAFTGIHIWQEAKARPPLYRVFGAVAGFWFPGWIGFFVFTVLLPMSLFALGIIAYAGWLPFLGVHPVSLGVLALGAVLGARLGDSIISHWTIFLRGYRPNPGLSSTVLYALEAIVIFAAFQPGFALDRSAAWRGFAIGFLTFLLVIPLMMLFRKLIKSWQRERWIRGMGIPDWAVTWT
jgi:hypothetical protein